ncbi:membrane protein [Tenuibacillus multivorans]|uniref:Membrane protein CcdC involved in cytochrome C biogenesis n=2 Tax=Tenuibacillus multivorans TaxID=237069 RepID=A0A1H0CHB6_9BACI|nr:membrane protein [Tenuibacillus multivorans]SDN57250.1 Membrane protein CcdC involved in cytochrome C biogenesis [Tenuibacillus multivorans]
MFIESSLFAVLTMLMFIFMASVMIVIRSRASKKPASTKKIILPPLFMSTGALMFLFPYFQVSWWQVLEAISVGVVFSVLLIITSNFEIKGREIYLKPSKAFIFVLLFLLVLRICLKIYLGQDISVGETSGMFYLLAFGMLFTWRIAMLIKFLKLKQTIA